MSRFVRQVDGSSRKALHLNGSSSVVAIVLTYNAPEALDRCLAAIAHQTRLPDRVLVVDNASPRPAVARDVGVDTEVLRTSENFGPAGGHAAGLDWFRHSTYDIAWVMDDDCVADPSCLEQLLARYDERTRESLVLPWWIDSVSGQGQFHPAWCGFIVSRRVVERVGLPLRDLVWWVEDTEYVSWRMQRAGVALDRYRGAVVVHQRVRDTTSRPVWKVYYEARNILYCRLYIQRGKPLRRMHRMVRALAHLFGSVLADGDRRGAKIVAYGRGILDGLRKRLGRRMALER
jgi:rhamnopyranosyl-N-acetylglucosaminyl-diphospho-decaprenol beta-1,3/1,4-galactofuranosyltransferase